MARYRFFALFVLALLLLGGCTVPGIGGLVRGSGNIETESREVSGFSRVDMTGSGTLLIERGDSEALTIEADDNLLEYLTSEVSGDTLVLGTRPNTGIQPSQEVVYRLMVVNLDGITLSGSGEVSFDGVDSDNFSVEISGSGDVNVAGQADQQAIEISGSGTYIAPDLQSRVAEVNVSGSGGATVNVSEALDVEISGSGNVTYIGDPEVRQDISGSGDLNQQ